MHKMKHKVPLMSSSLLLMISMMTFMVLMERAMELAASGSGMDGQRSVLMPVDLCGTLYKLDILLQWSLEKIGHNFSIVSRGYWTSFCSGL